MTKTDNYVSELAKKIRFTRAVLNKHTLQKTNKLVENVIVKNIEKMTLKNDFSIDKLFGATRKKGLKIMDRGCIGNVKGLKFHTQCISKNIQNVSCYLKSKKPKPIIKDRKKVKIEKYDKLNYIEDLTSTTKSDNARNAMNDCMEFVDINEHCEDWDERLLTMLSKRTAKWIVNKCVVDLSNEQKRFFNALQSFHGEKCKRETDFELISETDLDEKIELRRKVSMLPVKYSNDTVELSTDPYSDNNAATFYRQPFGLRKEMKEKMFNEEKNDVNSKKYQIPFKNFGKISLENQIYDKNYLRLLKDSRIVNTIIKTDNEYVHQLYAGANILFKTNNNDIIFFNSRDCFEKQLQKKYPIIPNLTSKSDSMLSKKNIGNMYNIDQFKITKKQKCNQRWTKLPKLLDPFVFRKFNSTVANNFRNNASEITAEDIENKLNLAKNKTLVDIADLWKMKHLLVERCNDATVTAIKNDIFDNQTHIRLISMNVAVKFIQNCTDVNINFNKLYDNLHLISERSSSIFATEFIMQNKEDIYISPSHESENNNLQNYEESIENDIDAKDSNKDNTMTYNIKMQSKTIRKCSILLKTLKKCLNDTTHIIQTEAAKCLLYLGINSTMAENILLKVLYDKKSLWNDRYESVVALGKKGNYNEIVLDELIKQILFTENPIVYKTLADILINLSINTTLIQSMIAEHLNSISWRYRVISCQLLPCLYGDISDDITNKLKQLMWRDPHAEVRRSAGQALGKAGRGRDVHEALCNIMTTAKDGAQNEKVEALKKIAYLGIVTTNLLPSFLSCFDDKYVSVRREACIVSFKLKLKQPEIIEKLIFLASHDPIWEVKSKALRAIGKIGVKSEKILNCVRWALRYEIQVSVRESAFYVLKKIDREIKDEDNIACYLQRLSVETNASFSQKIKDFLISKGIELDFQVKLVEKIRNKIKALNNHNNISRMILESQ
ncbi:hypothetical protein A3Q56_03756 [Intoshia linei]|uniref:HEAT repeat-containing protein 4 n=1 Tax=Intoshia linei TaxID=1819745 RepID=A0A177B2S5_9BILA|nr:hypothetical protein A3Q56_03756 [Intoshia linei]